MSTSESALTDLEAERGLIGAAFHHPEYSITLGLEARDFAEKFHQDLWRLAARAATTGAVFACGPLAQQHPDAADYLFAMLDLGELSKVNPAPLASRVKVMATRRAMRNAAQEFITNISDIERHPEDDAILLTSAIGKNMSSKRARSVSKVRESIFEHLKQQRRVISTGITELDGILGGGLCLKKCLVIAALTKVGKTVLAGTISYNLNANKVPNLFCALEMSDEEVEERNLSREMGINVMKFITAPEEVIKRSMTGILTYNDYTIYESRAGATFEEFRAMVLSAKINYGIKGFFLDSLQLVTGKEKGQTEEHHLRNVAQWCADICREQDLFSVVTCQVVAAGERAGGPRGGEGVRLAADVYLRLHRELGDVGAWLAMENSRYLPYVSAGSETNPGLIMEPCGPYFRGRSDEPSAHRWS